MRILLLAQFFYPPTIGGEERHVADLCNELAARGHQVSVATLMQKEYPAFEIDHGVHIHRISGTMQRMGMLFSESDRRFVPPFPDPELMYELRRVIKHEQPDIIHSHDWITRSFTPLKAWSKAKLVVTLHSYGLICVQRHLMYRDSPCSGPNMTKCLKCATHFYGIAKGPPTVLANHFYGEMERRAVDMFLPVSQAVVEGNQLDRHKVPYRIIPNFVPDNIDATCEDTNPLLAQLPKGDFLLFVGDVTYDKGAAVLLQAYAELNTQVPLVLIGRPLLPRLSEILPPNVFVMGGWSHDAVMAAWSRCSIGLVPSIVAETFGIVALEAMSMGKPVIAARSGGLTDVVINDETGLLVPPGDHEALREAIQRLLDDPVKRECMGRMARQRVKAFHARVVVPHIEQVYQEVVAS